MEVINKVTGKILSVQVKSEVGSGIEVWTRDRGWGGLQSFYIDELSNGNIAIIPYAFPELVLNLPERHVRARQVKHSPYGQEKI
jgi:hypothetical protein